MLQTNGVPRDDGRRQVLVEHEARHLGAMPMDRRVFVPTWFNCVQVLGRERTFQQRMLGLNTPIKDTHHRRVIPSVLYSRLQLTYPVMLLGYGQTRKKRGYFVRPPQLGDVINAPEGCGELFAGGTDEHDRSVTESKVVVAHREAMLPGVLGQSLVLSTVSSPEP